MLWIVGVSVGMFLGGILFLLLFPLVMRGKSRHQPLVQAFQALIPEVILGEQEEEDQPDPEFPPQGTIKVLSLNLAHGRRNGSHQVFQSTEKIKENLEAAAEVIRRECPTVVALQEADRPSLWSGNFDHGYYVAEKADLPYAIHGEHVHGMRLRYGTAILSREPLKDPLSIAFAPSPPTPSKGFVVSSFDWPEKPYPSIDVVSVHLDFALPAVRKQQIKRMVRTLLERDRPRIILGDFNCQWPVRKKTRNGAMRLTGERTLPFLAKSLNLKAYQPECLREYSTFPFGKSRIDWVFLSPELEFCNYQVLPDVLSDHLAVCAEICWNVQTAIAEKEESSHVETNGKATLAQLAEGDEVEELEVKELLEENVQS
ncbi:Endo/exonuclease/phosphatase domain-containing protein [Planctomycetales bacterium 10988]|nr:Endo/exonuclease/phosphatase domain-containing protein [Planctomycetales bacterium 10988]